MSITLFTANTFVAKIMKRMWYRWNLDYLNHNRHHTNLINSPTIRSWSWLWIIIGKAIKLKKKYIHFVPFHLKMFSTNLLNQKWFSFNYFFRLIRFQKTRMSSTIQLLSWRIYNDRIRNRIQRSDSMCKQQVVQYKSYCDRLAYDWGYTTKEM